MANVPQVRIKQNVKVPMGVQNISTNARTMIRENLQKKSTQTKDIQLLHDGVYVEYLALDGSRPIYKVLSFTRDKNGVYQNVKIQKLDAKGNLDTQKFNTTMDKLQVLWIQPGDIIEYRDINLRTKSEDIFKGSVDKILYDRELIISCFDPRNAKVRTFTSFNFPHLEILGNRII